MKKKIIAGAILGVVVLSVLFAFSYGGGKKMTSRTAAYGGKVGVVYIDGTISGGHGDAGLWSSGVTGESVSSVLRKAADNPEIKAVVIRLNSPGGTPAAAQEISLEVNRLRESGKVVVASMGDTAASAAYWVAAVTDEIVASPGTVTGSIGVIMETTNLQGLYDKLGIEVETVKSGPYKDMGSPSRPVTPEERDIMQSMIDDIYDQFVEAVAQGRGMEVSQVRQVADGRVFTGRQAMDLGLVDRMGDLQDAVDLAGEMAGINGRPAVVNIGGNNIWRNFFGGMESLMGEEKMILLNRYIPEYSFSIK